MRAAGQRATADFRSPPLDEHIASLRAHRPVVALSGHSETIYYLCFPDEADIADMKFGRDRVAKMSRFKNLALTMLPTEQAGA
jgi:hypothetical protein